MGNDARNGTGYLIVRKAVEKEVRNDQIVLARLESKATNIGADGLQTGACSGRCAFGAATQFGKHGRAGIDGVHSDGRVRCQQPRSKTAIAIAQNESPAGTPAFRKKLKSAALERAPEAEIFHPPVNMREPIEVRRAPIPSVVVTSVVVTSVVTGSNSGRLHSSHARKKDQRCQQHKVRSDAKRERVEAILRMDQAGE